MQEQLELEAQQIELKAQMQRFLELIQQCHNIGIQHVSSSSCNQNPSTDATYLHTKIYATFFCSLHSNSTWTIW